MKKYNKLFLLILFFFLSISSFCFAIDELNTEEADTFAEIGQWGFNFILSTSVLAAFGVLVWAGFMWLTSAGDTTKISEAKTKIKAAIIGLLIIFFSYLIITTINPELMLFKSTEFKIIQENDSPYTPDVPEIEDIVYQEIPLGQLTENILAKNISCFNDDGDLVNCNNKEEIIEGAPEDIFAEDNHIYYCYKYDSNGNRAELLENKDRLYCYSLLLDAAKIKFEKMLKLMEEIESLSKACNCSRCSGGSPSRCISGSCGVPCKDECSCCGSPRGEWNPFCNGPYTGNTHVDPCPNRDVIDDKREELSQLLSGSITDLEKYYDSSMDPEVNKKFVTIQNIKGTFELIKKDFEKELKDLNTAKNLMMFPSGDRISRNEFNALKSKNSALGDKSLSFFSFNQYDSVVGYCYEYNCTDKDKDGLKENCLFNEEARYCEIREDKKELSYEGDPATFYFNENETKNYFYSDLTCTIESKIEEGIMKGLIPIGETVDGSDAFSVEIISYFDNFIKNTQKLILEGEEAYMYPENCHCGNCGSSAITESECCSCCDCEDCMCSSKSDCDCLGCTTCSGNICPYNMIRNIIKETKNILYNYTTLLNVNQSIINYNNFITAKNLKENEPNRFILLNLLDISRERLNTCFTKYSFDGSINSAIMDTISCESIYNWRNKGYLTTYPDFILTENQGYFDCYPYNTDENLRGSCVLNLDSVQCLQLRSTYMNNYYCCND